jgi:uncharacterized phage protein (TIGR02220 family)
MTKGWVKIHRAIKDDWIWQDKPFSRGQAWIDLILMANYNENKSFIDGKLINVERGQLITSTRKLSEKWSWSRTKIIYFLTLLESDKKIIVKSDTKKTAITIINYGLYQDKETTEMTQKSHRNDTDVTQKNTNKNIKNVKKEKNNIYTAQAKEILDYLNLKTGKNFKPVQSHLDEIGARLKEGNSVDDCKRVIDIKTGQWLNTEHDKYLRPQTLFRASKFDGYLNERECPKKKTVNHMTVSKDFSLEEQIERRQRENQQKGGKV